MISSIDTLREKLRQFAAERDWEQFHSPKNLATALAVEAAELLELFQWLSDDQSRSLSMDKKAAAGHEMADVLLYLIQLADKLDIDLLEAAKTKIEINASKYPVSLAKGTASKYSEL